MTVLPFRYFFLLLLGVVIFWRWPEREGRDSVLSGCDGPMGRISKWFKWAGRQLCVEFLVFYFICDVPSFGPPIFYLFTIVLLPSLLQFRIFISLFS